MATKVGTNNSETISATDSADYVYGLGGSDVLDGFNGNDVMFGGDGDDWVYGGHNNDTLYGGAGNDHLYGQEDNDVLVGGYDGAGDDVLDGGSGYDTVDYSSALNPVIVNLSTGKAQGGDVGHDTLYSIEHVVGSANNDIIKGTESGIFGIGGNDVLDGGGGADFINGLSGNDSLYGGDGNDTLVGGAGNDYLDGGAGVDIVSFQFVTPRTDAFGTWGADMDNSHLFNDSEGVDTFVNVEDIFGSQYNDILDAKYLDAAVGHTINAAAGNDSVDGAAGNDTLIGGDGNDYLVGHGGADTLTGGSGVDAFHINYMPSEHDTGVGAGNRDIVTDFQHGTDALKIIIHDDPSEATANSLSFIGQSNFTGENQLRYSYQGSDTIVQANLDSDALPEFEIQLTGHVVLTASDFYTY
jgi:Ca2+-binding RTX toxin-like protein